MPSSDTAPSRLGPLIATYGKSRSFLFAWMALAAIFGGAGLFVLWLTTRIGPDFSFSGDVSLLYMVGFGGVLLGLAVAAMAWWLASSQPTFELYQNGIRAFGRGGDHSHSYEDIEDLFTFMYGGIGYRASPQTPWIFIGARIHKVAQLSQRLRAAHVEQRGARLYKALMAGQTVVFRYFEDSVAWSKSMAASRNMNYPTAQLELTATTFKLAGKQIEVRQIGDISAGVWSETAQIRDAEGKLFHKMHATAVLSFDVLHALIAQLQSDDRDGQGATALG